MCHNYVAGWWTDTLNCILSFPLPPSPDSSNSWRFCLAWPQEFFCFVLLLQAQTEVVGDNLCPFFVYLEDCNSSQSYLVKEVKEGMGEHLVSCKEPIPSPISSSAWRRTWRQRGVAAGTFPRISDLARISVGPKHETKTGTRERCMEISAISSGNNWWTSTDRFLLLRHSSQRTGGEAPKLRGEIFCHSGRWWLGIRL